MAKSKKARPDVLCRFNEILRLRRDRSTDPSKTVVWLPWQRTGYPGIERFLWNLADRALSCNQLKLLRKSADSLFTI